MKKIDTRGLATLIAEATALTNRSKLTSVEEKRFNLLTAQISVLKQGDITLDELSLQETNETMRRNGLPEFRVSADKSEARAKAEAWQVGIRLLRENRTASQTEGDILARIGTYTGLGTFVPTEFIAEIYSAVAAHDAFLDEDAVTVLNSKKGRPTTIPTIGDIENVAVVVGESADTSSGEHLIAAPGHAVLGAYSYRSPLWRVSIEAMQDVEAMGDAVNIFKSITTDRIARGVAKDLVSGNGSGKPLGIVSALAAAGVTPITAEGSAANTGGSEDGTNSIGTKDIAKLFHSVNAAYRNMPKTAFFMNDATLAYLDQLVNKMGSPIVKWQGPQAYIFGKPVKISPSMEDIGVSKTPIIFGAGEYWVTRKVINDDTNVQLVKEAAGLIEKGEMALRMFTRFDGALLYNDAGSPAPFGVLQNHS